MLRPLGGQARSAAGAVMTFSGAIAQLLEIVVALALAPLLTGENAAFAPKWDDEIVKAAVLTRDGQVVHAALKDG